jgi:hypothetical protein
VLDIKELKNKAVEECDRLAHRASIAARTLATAEGAVTGVGGIRTTTIDVPLLFISALRTIVRISHCYEYSGDDPRDRYFNLGILTIATAGTLASRLERLDQLQDLEKLLIEETQVDLIRSELLSFLFQLDIPSGLLRADVLALLGHRALHEEDERDQSKREDAEEPEIVEVCQRSRLLLNQVLERLQGQLLRRGRVTRQLKVEGSALLKKRIHHRVERIKKFAHSRRVEMFAPPLDGRGQ